MTVPAWHRIGDNPYNAHSWITGDPQIGQGTWVGAFVVLDGSGGLTIGRGVDISSGVQIYSHSSVRRCVSEHSFASVERAPTTIGDFVFIGANAVVNMGVSIGDHAIVGSGAVVTSDVEPYSIVVGVPARRVGSVVIAGAEVSLVYDE